MAAATKKSKKELTSDVQPISLEQPIAQVFPQSGICINCANISLSWAGPKCASPQSEFYKKRVRDEDTCSFFKAKQRAVVVQDDGLYDPEPDKVEHPIIQDEDIVPTPPDVDSAG